MSIRADGGRNDHVSACVRMVDDGGWWRDGEASVQFSFETVDYSGGPHIIRFLLAALPDE